MIKNSIKLFIIYFMLTGALQAVAASPSVNSPLISPTDTLKKLVYPVPPPNPLRLFYIQRSPNINALSYDLNIDQKTGKPDENAPVHGYWLRYAEGHGEPAEFTYMQRKFAYGIISKALGNDRYDIRLVSYKKIPLTLMKGADGKYHIFATIAQKQVLLQKIFIQIDGGTFWLPNVIFVEMKGTDPGTGKEVTERFKP
ncbi:DUF4833 domain-containing protein [Mucilaginibacter sp. 14171R-50]|uniref:DUF4833 domain-containing protein n=1 Tax=Mucilaginibacter sp. 14171R-50 TaxID=2703789 RepID=UPI00138DCC34|nr:DUF4833 domain-containing protein [Mucilaginibacter sp. 14171R-50]QHS57428.1 DUF4833 domain-containing protein [Mucilaginibacter sp. 14171R-50]